MKTVVRVGSFTGPWGPIWLASTEDGLCGVELKRGRAALEEDLGSRRAACLFQEDPPALRDVVRQFGEYFGEGRRDFEVELDLWGTPFQKEVWKALTAIPFGETRSYQEIAAAVNRPRAVRAVGQANGRNPVPIVVPCHRVIRSGGGLGGFGSGLEIKRRLLALESRAR